MQSKSLRIVTLIGGGAVGALLLAKFLANPTSSKSLEPSLPLHVRKWTIESDGAHFRP